jgi:P4 family phage/plasmid primase-like protien
MLDDSTCSNSTQSDRPAERPNTSDVIDGSHRAICTVAIGEKQVELTADHFADSAQVADALYGLGLADGAGTVPVMISATDVGAWGDESRYALWTLLMNIKHSGANALVSVDGQEPKQDPFEAALLAVVGDHDLGAHGRSLRVALEAAGLFHANALDAAGGRLAGRMKELGVKGVLPQTMAKQARQFVIQQDEGESVTAKGLAAGYLRELSQAADLPEGYDGPGLRLHREDWYRYGDGRWVCVKDADMRARVTKHLQGQDELLDISSRFLGDVLVNLQGLANLPTWDESLPFRVLEEGEQPKIDRPRLIALENGMIDADEVIAGREPKLLPHDPRWLSTARLPFPYEPTAPCLLWPTALAHWLDEDEERIRLLQEFSGYCLVFDTQYIDRMIMLLGDGSTGKSSYLRVLRRLVGSENCSHVPLEKLGGDFYAHEMAGKLVNIGADMAELDRVAEGLLKMLTGGDSITANRKFRSMISMQPTARLIFATNVAPRIADDTDGIWRRLTVVPFTVKITEDRKFPGLVDTICTDELPGVFNWALEGLARLFRQEGYTRSVVCDNAKARYRHDCDPVQQFVDECVTLDPEGRVPTKVLFAAYSDWCEDNGRHPFNSANFGRRVLKLSGVTKRRDSTSGRMYFYEGINRAIGESSCPWQPSVLPQTLGRVTA